MVLTTMKSKHPQDQIAEFKTESKLFWTCTGHSNIQCKPQNIVMNKHCISCPFDILFQISTLFCTQLCANFSQS